MSEFERHVGKIRKVDTKGLSVDDFLSFLQSSDVFGRYD